MKPKIKALILLVGILGIPMILLGWIFHSSRSRGIPIGQKFPSIHLRDLDGNDVKLDGKTLLVFFRFTCPYCQAQLSNLEELSRHYHPENLHIIAVSLDDKKTAAIFLGDYHPPYPVVIDSESTFTDILRERSIPAIYLIDETGIVRYRRNGYHEIKADDRIMKAFLRASEEVSNKRDEDSQRCESGEKEGDQK